MKEMDVSVIRRLMEPSTVSDRLTAAFLYQNNKAEVNFCMMLEQSMNRLKVLTGKSWPKIQDYCIEKESVSALETMISEIQRGIPIEKCRLFIEAYQI